MKKFIILLTLLLFLACCSGSQQAMLLGDKGNDYISSVTRLVEGRQAGVLMNSSSSNPEKSPSMLIRGINSINAGTEPLYILDGMPYNGPINMINPYDVESIKVLKNPSETSIYGIRGGNGVVVITTKKGFSSKKN